MDSRQFFSRRRTDSASYPVRSWRPEWLPEWVVLHQEERVHPHVPQESADLFLCPHAAATEVEVLNWLHAFICLVKPESVLETGASRGLGTIALASACKANGFGKVHSVELDPELCRSVNQLLSDEDLSEFAVVHNEESRNFLQKTNLQFQFAFFDSLCEIRAEEYMICMARSILQGVAVFHDTSPTRTETMNNFPAEPLHKQYRDALYKLAKQQGTTGYFESFLSRGLIAIFPREGSTPVFTNTTT